jgi:hypothetical protein
VRTSSMNRVIDYTTKYPNLLTFDYIFIARTYLETT